MTSAILIALVGLIYSAVAIDQFCLQHNFWAGTIWLGYAISQAGLWQLTIHGKV
jgi:hypothetical protein